MLKLAAIIFPVQWSQHANGSSNNENSHSNMSNKTTNNNIDKKKHLIKHKLNDEKIGTCSFSYSGTGLI